MGSEAPRINEFHLSAANAATLLQKRVERGDFIRVVSHLDADGLTAASIMGKALDRIGAMFRIRVTKQVDERLVEELKQDEPSPVVFTDLGSGSLDLLKVLKENDIIILDHHPPTGETFPKLCQVNPHLDGLDGSREISGAGVSYLVAKALDGSNTDLASLSVVGALGDSQDKFKGRSLGGANEGLVKDAVDSGYLRVDTDLLFYGRETRPVHKALAYTTNPFIPSLSGEEDKCLAFLINLGISVKNQDRWRSISDLSDEEKQRLFSELAKHLASKKMPSKVAMGLIGTIYTLVHEDRWTSLRDGREFASILNACGRMNKSGVGISIGLGNRISALDEAQQVFGWYKKTLSDYMDWVSKTPRSIERLKNVYVINGSGVIDELMLSTIASILVSSGFFDEPKPIIALTSTDEGTVKVSGRLPDELRESYLNLGSIFHEASEHFLGVGGGHDVAAGAQVQSGQEMEFVRFIDQRIGDKLHTQ